MHHLDPNKKARKEARRQIQKDVAILNKSWRQHPTKHQLYGHLPPITKIIQVRRTRHAGHCWRSRDELISDVLLCTPTYGRAKAGRPTRTCIQQLCEDTGYSPEDLPEAMNDREKWRERVRDIRASGTTRWWWDRFSYKRYRAQSVLLFTNSCPWCNCYRRRKWTRRHEFKSSTRLIAFSHSTNTLGKGMNPIILPSAMGK